MSREKKPAAGARNPISAPSRQQQRRKPVGSGGRGAGGGTRAAPAVGAGARPGVQRLITLPQITLAERFGVLEREREQAKKQRVKPASLQGKLKGKQQPGAPKGAAGSSSKLAPRKRKPAKKAGAAAQGGAARPLGVQQAGATKRKAGGGRKRKGKGSAGGGSAESGKQSMDTAA